MPEERRARCSPREAASEPRSAASSPTTSSGSSRVAEYDAVIVGSGVNGLACGALLAQAGWRVCVLERNDWLGGAIKTAELTEPGFMHDVFSAWHPLWVGGAAHAQLGDDARRARARVPEHRAPDRDALSRTAELRSCSRTAEANAAELDRHHAGDGDAWSAARGVLPERRPRLRRARHRALVASRRSRSARRRSGGSGGSGAAEFAGELLDLGARLARDDVRVGARARAARAVGAAHRARAGRGRVRATWRR